MKNLIVATLFISTPALASEVSVTHQIGSKTQYDELRSEDGTDHFAAAIGVFQYSNAQTTGDGLTISLIPKPVNTTYFELKLPLTVGAGVFQTSVPESTCTKQEADPVDTATINASYLDPKPIGNADADQAAQKAVQAQRDLAIQNAKTKHDLQQSSYDNAHSSCQSNKDLGKIGFGMFYEASVEPTLKFGPVRLGASIGYRKGHQGRVGNLDPKQFDQVTCKIGLGIGF